MKLADAMPRRHARVEMIPLIDCVFIVLVFFIYSMLAMTIRRGIDVELPVASTQAIDRQEAIVVTVTADGVFLVDDRAVTPAELGPALDGALDGLAEPRVSINADAGSEHRWFVQVMDELRRRGVARVTILSQEAAP